MGGGLRGIFFLKVEEATGGKGYVHAPFRGGAQIQILWGQFFEVMCVLKVEEIRRGKGYVRTLFRGGAQIQILWGGVMTM